MGEVILLPAVNKGGQVAPPQFGPGNPQQQPVQAGQRRFPLGRNRKAPEPLARLLIARVPRLPVLGAAVHSAEDMSRV